MIIHRRLRVAVITASCATLAVLSAASGAIASSNATTTGQIKACYNTSGSLPPLDHIAATAKCPTGDSSLTWNKVGPQGPPGPAGISTGLSAGTFVPVTLDTGSGNYFPVLSTSGAPATGTYYVNASVVVWVNQGDSVVCQLRTLSGYVGVYGAVGPFAVATSQTISLAYPVSLTAGQGAQVVCGDTTDDEATFFNDGSLTGILINNPVVGKPSLTTRRPLPPHR